MGSRRGVIGGCGGRENEVEEVGLCGGREREFGRGAGCRGTYSAPARAAEGSRTAAILGVRASCPRGAHRVGGAELVKRGRVLCHPSGGGVGAGHGALGLGFQKGHAVHVQGACARVRASGGGWRPGHCPRVGVGAAAQAGPWLAGPDG